MQHEDVVMASLKYKSLREVLRSDIESPLSRPPPVKRDALENGLVVDGGVAERGRRQTSGAVRHSCRDQRLGVPRVQPAGPHSFTLLPTPPRQNVCIAEPQQQPRLQE